MKLEKWIMKKKILTIIFFFIPIIILILMVLLRYNLVTSNEEIIKNLKDIKYYSSEVEYLFKNSKSEFSEKTIQYYSKESGRRIEFQDEYKRVKVYNGAEIKVECNQEEFILDKDIDTLYPLAFIDNVLSNPIVGDIKEVKTDWGDNYYLEVDIKYNSKNKHLNKAKFYVDKNRRTPVLLKILDDTNKERVIVKYKDFKKEKSLDSDLF